ncbi:cation-translocating P-type ATPase [Desulfocurvibacter africanus]|uniref:ATPase, P-type (Transporting), HAD superfamily, subfamily IC n=1 Tax=Desulfocurvibacter africanus subsp. africanus str. Walvis Bay TaxID=690850 RepID=F3Z1B0_DESAF|nr:cation-transporting P-type ATPase [Desulfocurvibacter africanus]EGJ51113.1 ATPase, P-type (transporting), HAD superfamily, subfamily IC [Desulfocurvibacter africanus subsp. africanus str. Walvis Bay]
MARPDLDMGRIPAQSVEAIMAGFGVGPGGLSLPEVQARLERLGENNISHSRGKPLALRFLDQFTHLMAVLLWAGGGIAFAARLPQLGVSIWLVNIINGAFGFWMEYKAEKAMKALLRLMPESVTVMRDGIVMKVGSAGIVPGDVVILAEGDRVPADGRVIEEYRLRVDQSTLTGESIPASKTAAIVENKGIDAANLVFAGTTVSAGEAKALIFATGMDTLFGRIAGEAQAVREEPSPLQQELRRVTRSVTFIALGVGLVFFLLAALFVGVRPAESFIFALGMIVAFVPEGLLPTVTLSLAMGVRRMAANNALIKRLSSVETLGCATVICTDKTGTLTENEMTVVSLWTPVRQRHVTGTGYSASGQIEHMDDAARLALQAGCLCNTATLTPKPLGDPTEIALLVAAAKAGLDPDAFRSRFRKLHEIPFESERKRMSVIIEEDGLKTAYVKGAPDSILALSSRLSRNDDMEPISATARDEIIAANDTYARAGYRVLALARRELPRSFTLPDNPDLLPQEAVETDLDFLGLAAMLDPPRPGVLEAVDCCHAAGIRIIMITGDNPLTAESIARRLDILRGPQAVIVSGSDLERMDDQSLSDRLRGDVVFARVSPEIKLHIVETLQQHGEVVAMTGDGVNDAPALKRADIGVAMGRSGTDAAKEAADMILADDNFASIVRAIEEGRAVFVNIKKFITYIFTSNIPEAIPFFLFVMSLGRIPLALGIMLILAVDLGTDMLPAIALGAEPAEPGIMKVPPRDRRERLITPALLRRSFLFLGLIQGMACMAVFYYYYWTNGYAGQWLDLPSEGPVYASATALTFAAVVVTQIGNLFVQRAGSRSAFHIPLGGNRLLWPSIATELAVMILVIHVPFLQGIFGTAPFAARDWIVLAVLIPLLPLADELRKCVLRKRSQNKRAMS